MNYFDLLVNFVCHNICLLRQYIIVIDVIDVPSFVKLVLTIPKPELFRGR